jgi:hypothetical protein
MLLHRARRKSLILSHTRGPRGSETKLHERYYSLSFPNRLCLTQVDRWRNSVSDVVEYVTTEKVSRIYFQHTSCVHTPVGNSNTLGLNWLITSYFEAFFLKERKNISDSLHKLRISHRKSFSHYKKNTCVSIFKMAARLPRLLDLKSELLSWPLSWATVTTTGERTCSQSCHVCVKWADLTDNSFIFRSIRLTTDPLYDSVC